MMTSSIRMSTIFIMIVVGIESQFENNDDRMVFSSYEDQVKYMRRCVELAKEAVKHGQAPVRMVIFRCFSLTHTH